MMFSNTLLKRAPLFLFLSVFFLESVAQIPSGYYTSANGKSGTSLKIALQKIIRGHTRRSYNQLWSDFQTTDKKSNGKVWDMYSDIPGGTPSYEYTFSSDQCGTYSGEGDCYNREHSFPKAWWGGGTSSTDTMYTDLFQLVPTDGYVNSQRSNYPYGEINSPTWTSTNGSRLGPCSYPGYTGTVFEPIDDYKGDFARNYLYMATRYLSKIDSWGPYSDMLDGSGFSSWAINLLRDWHQQDPVSQKEIDRNNAVYGIQGNRNPFIDHPEYVPRIWGGNDVYAPVNTDNYPAIDASTADGFSLHVNIDESGTVYYVILSQGAAAPSASQVRSGSDASGGALSAPYKGSLSVNAGFSVVSTVVSGLSASTSYDVYFVAEDNQSPVNLQDSPVKVNASTSGGGGGGGGNHFSDLVISEYVEGSSNNKYLELYNHTGATVNLNNYSVKIYYNGNNTPGSTIALSGNLADNSCYVIANNSATVWTGTPDLTTNSLNFNGNDAVVLFNSSAKGNIDVMGTIGSSTNWGKDKTLRRNNNATGPSTSYVAAEWVQYGQNTVSGLGDPNGLPVQWLSFKAFQKGNAIELHWATASESNNRFFDVLYSTDGLTFLSLGQVAGSGNSTQVRHYSFVHRQAVGPAYYQLKQVDYDGRSQRSKTIYVNKPDDLQIHKVYYNHSALVVHYQCAVPELVRIEVFTLSGVLWQVYNTHIPPGKHSQSFELGALPRGMYFYRMRAGTEQRQGKFTVL